MARPNVDMASTNFEVYQYVIFNPAATFSFDPFILLGTSFSNAFYLPVFLSRERDRPNFPTI
jgi:hypothetical protein